MLLYLRYGSPLYKLASKPTGTAHTRFFFLSADGRKMFGGEAVTSMDGTVGPASRGAPSSTIVLAEVARVTIGTTTRLAALKEAETIGGSILDAHIAAIAATRLQRSAPAAAILPSSVEGLRAAWYRTLSFELAGGKAVDLAATTAADAEAWCVALASVGVDVELPPLSAEDVRGRSGGDLLSEEEVAVCAAAHVTPDQLATVKRLAESTGDVISAMDARALTGIDLYRAEVWCTLFVCVSVCLCMCTCLRSCLCMCTCTCVRTCICAALIHLCTLCRGPPTPDPLRCTRGEVMTSPIVPWLEAMRSPLHRALSDGVTTSQGRGDV